MNSLVKRAKSGDAEAFIALIEACKMTLQRVALGYLNYPFYPTTAEQFFNCIMVNYLQRAK